MQNNAFVVSACGVRVPKLIYGTAWKKERTAEWVEKAVRLGFRGLDTACQPKHYEEAGVGEGWSRCLKDGLARSDIYLQTKFTPVNGQDPKRMPYDPKASLSSQVAQSFEVSLKNLQTNYLDSLVLHSPLATEARLMEVWRAMEAIQQSGGARQLGISNCYERVLLEQLYQKAEVKPAVLQNRFYAQTGYDRELRAFCGRHGILYQSFWTLTANGNLLSHRWMEALAAKHGRSTEQVFFRYLIQSGIIPLTGTTSKTHMLEDLAIFDFELTEGELAAVAGLF